MNRIFLFVLILLIIVGGALIGFWAVNLPGSVVINDSRGELVSLHMGVAAIALIVFGGLVAAAWWLLSGLFVLPGKIGRARQSGLARKANLALTEGLLAAEAGDPAYALKLARKAVKHAEDERLKLLLEARAAEANDDWAGAERAWGQLTRLPGGQLAGLRGSAMAAAERGDQATAESRAREALGLKSNADWPFNSLFDLQVARGEWEKALETLVIGEKRGLIAGDSLRRRRDRFQTARAVGVDGFFRFRHRPTGLGRCGLFIDVPIGVCADLIGAFLRDCMARNHSKPHRKKALFHRKTHVISLPLAIMAHFRYASAVYSCGFVA